MNVSFILLLNKNNNLSIPMLWVLIVLFTIVAVFLFLVVFFNKQISNLINIRQLNAKSRSESFIIDLVFGDHSQPLKHEKWLMKTEFRKNILIKEIIKLKKDLYGNEAVILENYYRESGLIKLSLSKIRASRKITILGGLNELVIMNSVEFVEEMATLYYETMDAESKNYLISSILKLNPLYGLKLILKSNHYLTDWFQLVIIKSLDEIEYTDIPPLHLFEERGGSVASFGLKLASYLASKEHYTPSTVVVDLDLNIVLKDTYKQSDVHIQEQILNNLRLLGADLSEYVVNRNKPRFTPFALLYYFKSSLRRAFE